MDIGHSRRAPAAHSRPPGAARRAFTLVELLVVVAVIALLAAILVPTVSMAIRQAEGARSSARLKVIGNAAEAYHMQTGYYPGQDNPNDLWTGSGTNKYAGSQLLARCLFYDPAKTEFPSPLYAAVGGGDIVEFSNTTTGYLPAVGFPTIAGTKNIGSISDIFSRPLPFLYYPARLGKSATIGSSPWTDCALVYNDNKPLVEMTDVFNAYKKKKPTATLADMPAAFYGSKGVVDVKVPANVRRPDSFVLIGAGIDRCYFTDDDLVY